MRTYCEIRVGAHGCSPETKDAFDAQGSKRDPVQATDELSLIITTRHIKVNPCKRGHLFLLAAVFDLSF